MIRVMGLVEQVMQHVVGVVQGEVELYAGSGTPRTLTTPGRPSMTYQWTHHQHHYRFSNSQDQE